MDLFFTACDAMAGQNPSSLRSDQNWLGATTRIQSGAFDGDCWTRVPDHARIATQMFLRVRKSDGFRPFCAPFDGVSWAQLLRGASNKCPRSRPRRTVVVDGSAIQPARDSRLRYSSMCGSSTKSSSAKGRDTTAQTEVCRSA